MPYHIFICDDEPQMLQCLAVSVKNILNDSKISVFSDGSSLQKALGCTDGGDCLRREISGAFGENAQRMPKNGIEDGIFAPCDILLLDIDMPGLSGLEIARQLSAMERRPLLAFVTSHDELVYDSLQFHPFGFVRKSHMEVELEKLLKDCVRELSARERHFCFPAAGMRVKLRLDDILYFEAEGNYLKLFVREDLEKMPYRFRETLSAVEAALSGSGFVRVHKGYLVNQAAVKALGAEEALLINGARIPIGRSYAENAKKRLMRYMLDEL